MKNKLLIGVITTNCDNDFQSEIMRGIISQAFRCSCDIAVICPIQKFIYDSPHKMAESEIFRLIESDCFDGFIYDKNVFYTEKIRSIIDKLCTISEKPVMLLDSSGNSRFDSTITDDIEAFESVTDHLIDVHGLKRIYCLTGPKGVLQAEERLRGYLRSMKKHRLPVDKSFCFYGDFWKNSAIELAEKIISGKIEMPEGVVCGNDIMAVTLSEKLQSSGIHVPDDIAVTGFDASMTGYCSSPSVTSYKRPNFQMGADAVRRLYRIITGKICSKVHDEPGQLRIGKSCGCLEDPVLQKNILRQLKANQSFQEKLLYSDMLIDVNSAENLNSLIDTLDCNTYYIYKLSQLFIFLSDSFINKNLTENSLNMNKSFVNVLRKSAVKRMKTDSASISVSDTLELLRNSKPLPTAFYISPLHYNDKFFGYAAVSFGKFPMTYSSVYIQWLNYVNVALENLRCRSSFAVNVLPDEDEFQNPQSEKLLQLRNEMKQNPELNWNINGISEKLFISKSYLQKIYKSQFGKSIIEELIEFRIQKAKNLLINTDKTVSEIARECGYSTYNYFVRQFRASENLSPSEYRDINKL